MAEKQLNISGLSGEAPCADTHAARDQAAIDAAPSSGRAISAGAPGGVIARALPEGAASGTELAPRRGRGRPEGAVNIRDNETAQALIATYGDPLEADVAIGNADIGGLITLLRTLASDRGLKLGMSVGDVVRWQADCRRNALPYLRSKRAPVGADGKEIPPVVIGLGQASGAVAGGRSIEDVVDAEIEQDQGVSGAAGAQSHEDKSHARGK